MKKQPLVAAAHPDRVLAIALATALMVSAGACGQSPPAGPKGSGGSNGSGGGSGSGGATASGGATGSGGSSNSGSGGTIAVSTPPSNFHWVTTWATGLQATEPRNLPTPADDKMPTPDNPGFQGNTLRQIVHVTMGGNWVRLRLSNEYGLAPVTFEKVRVARSLGQGAIDTASDRALTFEGGKSSVTVKEKAYVDSDPFEYTLAPLSDLAITMKVGNQSKDVTGHPGSRTTSYLQTDDHVTEPSFASPIRTAHWYFISRLDVMGDENSGALVVLGDSLTDGRGSTNDANDRWPDALSRKLIGDLGIPNIAVVNQGIGGNALINGGIGPTAKSRFDHDVLQIAGVKWFIVLEGVNDIGGATSDISGDLINAFQEMVSKARDAKIKAYGSPILPFKGNMNYDKDDHQDQRKKVNDWIRAEGHFDAVVDLDAVVRDAADLDKLQDAFATLPPNVGTDYLHLNPLGYRAMGESVSVGLVK